MTFINKELCSRCGGKCCINMPGNCFPEDFKLYNKDSSLKLLIEALKSEKYCIDWWEGDPRKNKEEVEKGYYVRPATKDKKGILYDPSWGGECVFLTKKGCELFENDRPTMCRMLEPKKDGKCNLDAKYNKQNSAIAWIPYNDFLDNFKKD